MAEGAPHIDPEQEQLDHDVQLAYDDIAVYNPGYITDVHLSPRQEKAYEEASRRLHAGEEQPDQLTLKRKRKEGISRHNRRQQQRYLDAADNFREVLQQNEEQKAPDSIGQSEFGTQEEDKVVVPPAPPRLTDEALVSLPPMPLAPTGAGEPWEGWDNSQTGFNVSSHVQGPSSLSPKDPLEFKAPATPGVAPGAEVALFEGVRRGREVVVYEPKNLRRRLGDRFKAAKQAIADKYHGAAATIANLRVNTKEYFTDDEKGKRRKITAGVIGAIAVGVAGYGAYKFGVFGGGEHNGGTNTTGEGPGGATHTPTHTTELGGGDHTTPNHKGAPPESAAGSGSGGKEAPLEKPRFSSEASRTIKLGQGDTIWGQSESFLAAHGIDPTDENIDRVKDAVLEHYNISEVEATQLPVGGRYIIPREIIEELLKDNT